MKEDHSNNVTHSTRFRRETLLVIETVLDDFSPQTLAYTTEQLLKLGAFDAYTTPVTAKKGRSGHLLTVLCQPSDTSRIEEYIFDHTSTLGLRTYLSERLFLEREWVQVDLVNHLPNAKKAKLPPIRIKIARDLNGKIVHAQPEYEDCVTYAQSTYLPLKMVLARALDKYNQTANNSFIVQD